MCCLQFRLYSQSLRLKKYVQNFSILPTRITFLTIDIGADPKYLLNKKTWYATEGNYRDVRIRLPGLDLSNDHFHVLLLLY
jgi:hypothetical protein